MLIIRPQNWRCYLSGQCPQILRSEWGSGNNEWEHFSKAEGVLKRTEII